MDHGDPTRPSISPELLQKLAGVSSSTATALLMGLGYRNTFMVGIPALIPPRGQRMVGRAVTLRFVPMREDLVKAQYASLTESPHRRALEMVQPGDIVVMDALGSPEAAVLGDIFATRIRYRGGVGIVIDGVIRDLEGVRAAGLPVYARGTHGSGLDRSLMSAGVNEPIRCGGVVVVPGDILLGDETGVVVLPPQAVEHVAEHGIEKETMEEFIRLKVEQGASLHRAYPLDEEMRREFDAWLSSRRK